MSPSSTLTPTTLADALRSFETYLRVERNLSPRTRKAYLYDLGRFQEFLQQRGRAPRSSTSLASGSSNGTRSRLLLPAISEQHIRDYMGYLRDTLQYQPATLGRVVASVRALFEWAVESDLLRDNPAREIHAPKQARKLPIYLVEPEVRKLFDAPDVATYLGRRDRAILVVLANTGLRLQELVGLDITDLDFSRATLRVMGKGSKERLVPINSAATDALRALLADEERKPAPGERAVFLNARGRRLTGRAVQYIVEKYVRAAGITKNKVSPHKLRHTFATLLHNREVDLVDIQALMGHASIASTQIYTHTNPGKLQAAVDRLGLED